MMQEFRMARKGNRYKSRRNKKSNYMKRMIKVRRWLDRQEFREPGFREKFARELVALAFQDVKPGEVTWEIPPTPKHLQRRGLK